MPCTVFKVSHVVAWCPVQFSKSATLLHDALYSFQIQPHCCMMSCTVFKVSYVVAWCPVQFSKSATLLHDALYSFQNQPRCCMMSCAELTGPACPSQPTGFDGCTELSVKPSQARLWRYKSKASKGLALERLSVTGWIPVSVKSGNSACRWGVKNSMRSGSRPTTIWKASLHWLAYFPVLNNSCSCIITLLFNHAQSVC